MHLHKLDYKVDNVEILEILPSLVLLQHNHEQLGPVHTFSFGWLTWHFTLCLRKHRN
jgi:hypothetical protein